MLLFSDVRGESTTAIDTGARAQSSNARTVDQQGLLGVAEYMLVYLVPKFYSRLADCLLPLIIANITYLQASP